MARHDPVDFRSVTNLIEELQARGLLTDRIRPQYEANSALHYEDAAGDGLIDWEKLDAPLPITRRPKAIAAA